MITKTRLQFLAALFLVALPFLGIPAWLDTILVSASGLFIAFTTFLTARERRLRRRTANMIDAPKEVDVAVAFEKRPAEAVIAKPKRTRKKSVKEVVQQDTAPVEPVLTPTPEVVEVHTPEVQPEPEVVQPEPEPEENTYGNEPVPSPIDPHTMIKKVSRRRVKTPVLVNDTEDTE
ncbi:MAG: hypothetical protein COV34_00955 [Candidatus Zambryskibacteria bacterium CG10_big_fil_rev_8_21_14_0_10_42_12]|uniref:Uncharacterized protein n=1 Tax=Candidatus Zambryskibacteria bacterium CG10_big_fil_rev_8_21_14_0_10_42_12 TaxID=1975115 RepID=A0A2H0QV58_9BACT|nr:MAG: hypothetical protein COV34_00955 [Candidatus Zambryskibacteria bacterium CG10_big_fil_rev_8_21_14_0_10_42_12]